MQQLQLTILRPRKIYQVLRMSMIICGFLFIANTLMLHQKQYALVAFFAMLAIICLLFLIRKPYIAVGNIQMSEDGIDIDTATLKRHLLLDDVQKVKLVPFSNSIYMGAHRNHNITLQTGNRSYTYQLRLNEQNLTPLNTLLDAWRSHQVWIDVKNRMGLRTKYVR